MKPSMFARQMLVCKQGWFTLLMKFDEPKIWWMDQAHIQQLILKREKQNERT